MPDSVPSTTVNASSPPRQNSTLTALGLIVIAGVVLFVLVMRKNEVPPIDAALSHPAVGMPLPDFSVDVLTGDGKPFQSSDLHGKVTLISFWGTWCGYCVEEFPHIATLSENLRDNTKFQWLPVTYGNPPASPEQLRQEVSDFLARGGYRTTTYHDPENSLMGAATVAGAYQGGFPCTILLDSSGRVHAVWNGAGVEDQIKTAVMSLLK